VSALLGGSPDVAALVLAWYPVVAALCLGGLVYSIGAYVLEDRRVGVGAAILLALLPANALRTVVGFGDHHAFDYVWLLATAATLAWLVAQDDPSRRSLRNGTAALGVAVAGLTLAWQGAPLVLVPVAVAVAVSVPLAVAEGRSPWHAMGPVAAGLGLGAVLSLGVHLLFGWQSFVVVAIPGLLAGGTVALAAAGELVDRRGLSARGLVAAELAVSVVGLTVVSVLVDGAIGQLLGGIGFLLGTGGIGETGSAFAPSELFGVELLGLAHLVALPVMAWGVLRTLAGDRRWLVVCVYGWYFFVLSLVQARFVGQFASFVALFAATGVVWWAARYDLTTVPAILQGNADPDPDTEDSRRRGAWLDTDAVSLRSGLAVGLVVVAVLASSGAYLPGKVTGGVAADRNYETATWLADDAGDRGLSYPESYVFSRWGTNRLFNYFAGGWAEGYGYARDNYPAFLSSDDPERWYERLRNRAGYVVLEPLSRRGNPMQERLYVTYGSRWQGYEAVSHYRAVYTTENRDNKVFVLVPGARVTGQAAPNTTVEVRTTVDIPNDSFRYRQRATTGADGTYELLVPYPGEYEVRTGVGSGNATVTGTVSVPESAVGNGANVTVGA
jgi:dolichyl-diphosphooligosaccharide--protein glycosyltransferase